MKQNPWAKLQFKGTAGQSILPDPSLTLPKQTRLKTKFRKRLWWQSDWTPLPCDHLTVFEWPEDCSENGKELADLSYVSHSHKCNKNVAPNKLFHTETFELLATGKEEACDNKEAMK